MDYITYRRNFVEQLLNFENFVFALIYIYTYDKYCSSTSDVSKGSILNSWKFEIKHIQNKLWCIMYRGELDLYA